MPCLRLAQDDRLGRVPAFDQTPRFTTRQVLENLDATERPCDGNTAGTAKTDEQPAVAGRQVTAAAGCQVCSLAEKDLLPYTTEPDRTCRDAVVPPDP